MLLVAQACTKVVQGRLRDDPSITCDLESDAIILGHKSTALTKPSPIWLNSPRGSFVLPFLECGSLYDLAVPVSNGFSAVQHFNPGSLFRISIEVFSFDLLHVWGFCL